MLAAEVTMTPIDGTHEAHLPHAKELDPEAMTALLVEGFWSALAQRLEQAPTSDTFDRIRRMAEALERDQQDRVVDAPARTNLRIGCAVLAAYRALRGDRPGEELLQILEESFVGSMGETIRENVARALDQAPDPFQLIVGVSKEREQHEFGRGFTFERERDDDGAYLLNVRRCFWHDMFVANGAPELTRVLCAFDTNWISAIDPRRHGFRFDRPTTLGLGGARCPFHFRRVSGDVISSEDAPKDC
jgi:hypothetical protein